MVVVKIKDSDEWWVSQSHVNIHAMAASVSVNTGILLVYEVVDSLPQGLSEHLDSSEFNVTVYKPTTPAAVSNAGYQRDFRKRMKDQGMRLLRVWVPSSKYIEAKKICEELTNETS